MKVTSYVIFVTAW